ncbi:MAG: tripartite tricarboxylate transporter substrate binding protein [Burkholderiales bacterium]|nr:tripartite tricarboxylate transporter substrate binding protein [Burkholderiales bacterium]
MRIARWLILTLLAVGCAQAQDNYPARPVRIVVGLAPGGGIDVITRIVAQRLSEGLGQNVVVENRPGASGIIAAEQVMKAAADGYTLMMAPSGPMVFNAVMFPKLSYSPVSDFVPVAMVASFPLIAVVHPATPARSLRELADFARANPARANYAASTAAFQLATELFNLSAGIKMENINYKGTNESIAALMAGDVLFTIADSGPASAQLRAGKLRGLAVTSPRRMESFPDIPTVAEAGFPDLEVRLWSGLFAPAGTPRAVLRRLEDEVGRALAHPEVRERFATLTVSGGGASGEQLGRILAQEIERWGAVARRANVKFNP